MHLQGPLSPLQQQQQLPKPALLKDSGIKKRKSSSSSGGKRQSKQDFLLELTGLSQPVEKKPKLQRERIIDAMRVEMPQAAIEGLASMDVEDSTQVMLGLNSLCFISLLARLLGHRLPATLRASQTWHCTLIDGGLHHFMIVTQALVHS